MAIGEYNLGCAIASLITHHITHDSRLLSIIIMILDRLWLAVIVFLVLKFKQKQLSEYEVNVLPQRIHFVSVSACWFKLKELKGAKSIKSIESIESIEGKSDRCCTIVCLWTELISTKATVCECSSGTIRESCVVIFSEHAVQKCKHITLCEIDKLRV
jgi:hypothetical protein